MTKKVDEIREGCAGCEEECLFNCRKCPIQHEAKDEEKEPELPEKKPLLIEFDD